MIKAFVEADKDVSSRVVKDNRANNRAKFESMQEILGNIDQRSNPKGSEHTTSILRDESMDGAHNQEANDGDRMDDVALSREGS